MTAAAANRQALVRNCSLFLCLLVFLTVGCEKGPDKIPSVPKESRLVVAKPHDPVGLDPANVTDLESLQVTRQIYDTLVQFKPNSTEIEPALAESWTISDDGLSITFKLRPNIKFHDGTVCDARAVKLNYERQQEPDHPLRSSGDTFFYWNDTWGDKIERMEVVDELTLRFDFTEPIAPLLQNFAMPFFGVASPTALEKHGADFFRNPVGTGPYKFVRWLPGESLTLHGFSESWRGKPGLKEVVFLPVSDSTARSLRLRKGSVHLSTALSPQGVERLRESPAVEVVEQEGLNVAFLALNNKVDKLSDVRVRSAIWQAVDRDAVIRGLYYGLADRADTALPQGVLARLEQQGRAYDPEAGRKLMKEAGFSEENPLTLQFWYMAVPRSYFPEPKATAEAIARMLEEVYIECDLQPIDWGVYLDRVGRGEHELALAGWIGDHGDPDNYFSFLFSSTNMDEAVGGTNVLFYSEPKVDELIKEGRRTVDTPARVKIYEEIQEEIYDDVPWLPLAHARPVVGVHPRLQGFHLHPTGLILLHTAKWERS